MKYQLTVKEKQQLETGELITHACYHAKAAALCEYVGKYNRITYRFERSESPTGRQIFICFFFPHTLRSAYRLGDMLSREELYTEELRLGDWNEKFNALTTVV